MSAFYSAPDAVRALGMAIIDLNTLERQKSAYQYSLPEGLLREEHRTADRAVDAIRFLVGLVEPGDAA